MLIQMLRSNFRLRQFRVIFDFTLAPHCLFLDGYRHTIRFEAGALSAPSPPGSSGAIIQRFASAFRSCRNNFVDAFKFRRLLNSSSTAILV